MNFQRRRYIRNSLGMGCLATMHPLISVSASNDQSANELPPTRKLQRIHGVAFGTSWTLTAVTSKSEAELMAGMTSVTALVDRLMSPYWPDSEISRFNLSNSTSWIPVSSHTQRVVIASLYFARISNGAFDPTVGPIVNRYGFGPINGDNNPDYRLIQTGNNRIRKDRSGLTLDLCATAKGYALDLVVNWLRSIAISDALVECGGELRAIGQHPSGRPWRVAVERHDDTKDETSVVISLDNMAVATSSSQQNHFTYQGDTYHHLIDTRLLSPIKQNLLSVSVIDKNATYADGWATTLFLSGPEQGLALARMNDVSALFVFQGKNGLERHATGLWSLKEN